MTARALLVATTSGGRISRNAMAPGMGGWEKEPVHTQRGVRVCACFSLVCVRACVVSFECEWRVTPKNHQQQRNVETGA